jgi:hypothetical protein
MKIMVKEIKFPRWVKEKDECNFCGKYADCMHLEVRGVNVVASYPCVNETCSYLRFGRGNYISVLIYENSSERYEDFLTTPDPENVELKPEALDIVT